MIRRELIIFLVVGSLTVLIDCATYRSLVWMQWMSIDTAKAMGFIVGTLFAYFANRFWTFGHKQHAAGSGWRFVALYTVALSANVLINALVLSVMMGLAGAMSMAFLIATAVSAMMNFVGMKFFVFKAAIPLKMV